MRGADGPGPLALLVAGCAVLATALIPVAALIGVVRLIVWLLAG